MKKLLKDIVFIIGFCSVTLVFFILNISPYSKEPTSLKISNVVTVMGFPFPMYKEIVSSSGFITDISWSALCGNFAIALIFSLVFGFILSFVWSKISSRRLN